MANQKNEPNTIAAETKAFMRGLIRRNPHEPEFHQAVREAAETLMPYILENPRYRDARILERLTEPDRVLIFRVSWMDDAGNFRINRGYRVQHNNAIGPYKGGLRFHPSVNLSILKFLAFEQTLKNSLTTLPMGGAKGGSDFDPKGKSDNEVMRFCQSFMTELYKHIGKDTDVPAGDIGVGEREIGFLFGHYMRIIHEFSGAMTGKGIPYGGSQIRLEATGFGCVYFVESMLNRVGDDIKGKSCIVSGAGNVAQYTVQKLIDVGAKVLTMSDSGGFIHRPEGIDREHLDAIIRTKRVKRGRLCDCAEDCGCDYYEGEKPWRVPAEIAFPCATENEISEADARTMLKNGLIAVGEGANMPTELGGVHAFQDAKILYAPSKAANAGGVTVSGLELAQNAQHYSWPREVVDTRLRDIVKEIHAQCVQHGTEDGWVNYVKGANLSGFIRVADAMLAYGVV